MSSRGLRLAFPSHSLADQAYCRGLNNSPAIVSCASVPRAVLRMVVKFVSIACLLLTGDHQNSGSAGNVEHLPGAPAHAYSIPRCLHSVAVVAPGNRSRPRGTTRGTGHRTAKSCSATHLKATQTPDSGAIARMRSWSQPR